MKPVMCWDFLISNFSVGEPCTGHQYAEAHWSRGGDYQEELAALLWDAQPVSNQRGNLKLLSSLLFKITITIHLMTVLEKHSILHAIICIINEESTILFKRLRDVYRLKCVSYVMC